MNCACVHQCYMALSIIPVSLSRFHVSRFGMPLLLAGHRSSSEKQFFSFPPLSDKYIYFFVVVHSLSVLFFFDGDGNKTLDVSRFHAFIYIYISFHRAREKISHAKQRISCHYYYVLLLLLLLLRYKHTYTFREKRALTSILPHLTHAIHRPVW